MSTHNICFRGEIRKISIFGYPLILRAIVISYRNNPKYQDKLSTYHTLPLDVSKILVYVWQTV